MKKNWNKVADRQFNSLPDDIRADWGELREVIDRQK